MQSRIIYIQYTNPAAYPPLEHSSRILAAANFEVLFLGTGALGASALKFPEHERIRVRQMAFIPAGWQQKLHYLLFSLWVMWWTLRWRPGWLYASDPLSCPIALVLSYWPGLRVIYHEHDSPTFPGSGLFQRICFAARRRLARHAKVSILPNEQRAGRFAREMGGIENVRCVWNCPSLEEVAAQRNGHETRDLWVLYHGSIVPSRLPISVIEALTLLPAEVKLRIIGYETIGHQRYVAELKRTAHAYEVENRVEFLGTMPGREELLHWCRRSDVGLAFMRKASEDLNEKHMLGASNKPFDYLSCGLALLVSDLSDWQAMFVEPGFALACDVEDPASIAHAIGWFLHHPEQMRAMGERGRQRIAAEWNYEKQFQPVLEQIRHPR